MEFHKMKATNPDGTSAVFLAEPQTPILIFIIATLILICCASSNQNPIKSKGSRNVITAGEIAGSTATNAYDVIRLLRSHLLRYRGVRGQNVAIEPVVYLDNMRFGDINSLYNIHASNIQEIKYLNANDATTRYGTGHIGGAFVVTSK